MDRCEAGYQRRDFMKRAIICGTMLALAHVASANVLSNPGFEVGTAPGNTDVYGAVGWFAFGNAYNVSSPNPLLAGTHSGTGALKEFGTFPGVSGAFQTFAAAAGQTWSLSGFGLNASSDLMQPDNFGLLKISFQDAANNEILGIESGHITVSSPVDQWQALSASGVAPAGTDHVNFFALFVQPNFNGGSAFFDDMSAVPSPGGIGLLAASGLFLVRRRRA
jgi:MYXO-CTERM domain-containing protein